MNGERNPYYALDRIIVIGLIGLIVAGVVLVIAVVSSAILNSARSESPEGELQQTLEQIQDTTTDLQATVNEARDVVEGDPTLSHSLDVLDATLRQVDEQIAVIEEQIVPREQVEDEPPIEAVLQEDLDRSFTVISRAIGVISIITAVLLGWVLSARWRRRRLELSARADARHYETPRRNAP